MNFLYEEKGASSMRVFFILAMVFAGAMIMAMVFSVVWNTVNNKEVQWADMSVFLTAITAFTTATAWQKVQQKRIEVDQQINETSHDN